jgi:thiol:disulfide interchange protein DsbD
VIAASADFERFKVDLTRYDSAESEQLRSDYEITGVPTIVFLTPDGREVRAARVEGFLPADVFLERMRTAVSEGPRAQR